MLCFTQLNVEMTIYASKVADKKGSEVPSPEVVTDYTVNLICDLLEFTSHVLLYKTDVSDRRYNKTIQYS